MGATHGCGLGTDHSLWCWGDNSHGAVGDGIDVSRNLNSNQYTPERIGSATDWTTIAAGYEQTCGLRLGGTLWCWGNHVVYDPDRSLVPTKVADTHRFTSVSAGYEGFCAIETSGILWCQSSSPSFGVVRPFSPVGTATDWLQVTKSYTSTCAIRRDHTLWCFTMTDTFLSAAAQVGTDTNWSSISSTSSGACAIKTDGSLWCRGPNGRGQIGDGTTVNRPNFVRVPGEHWTSLADGGDHVCGLQVDQRAWCWGSNDLGQAGVTDQQDKSSPTLLLG